MTTTKRSLGRGLSELLSSTHAPITPTAIDLPKEKNFLPVDLLEPGRYQPRQEFHLESIQELANSIRAQGILQPILVRPLSQNRYEIIAGERRWRAAQMAGLQEIPVFIRDIPDEAAIAMSLIENIQREDLNVLEQAMALQRLSDEFNMTHEAVADAVGKSRATITNLLRLLQLPPIIKEMLGKNELEMGHARALLSLEATQQIKIAKEIIAKQLSVRKTESAVRQTIEKQNTNTVTHRADPDILRLQSTLSDTLGVTVVIQHTADGKGKLIMHYHSLDELEGILEHIK